MVDESDLMPADGRKYDDNDVVRLRRDVPSEGLTTGTVGVVSEVSPGPPVKYVVEFVNANGAVIARTALFDEDLSSPDEAPERNAGAASAQETGAEPGGPEETGLADDELDRLIAELRTQGQTMQQQSARERATRERESQARAEAAEQGSGETPDQQTAEPQAQPEEPPAQLAEPPVQQPAGGGQAGGAPPSAGRRTKFVRGEMVRLDADLPSAGFGAGTEGTVTWVILGPPVSYLIEFRNAAGGTGPPTKVEETYLSFAG